MARFRPRLRRTNDSTLSMQAKTARRCSRFRRLFPRLLPFDGFRKSRAVERLVSWFAAPTAGRSYALANSIGRNFGLQMEGLEARNLLAINIFIDNVATSGMIGTFNAGTNTTTFSPTADLVTNVVNVADINSELAAGRNVVVNNNFADAGNNESGGIFITGDAIVDNTSSFNVSFTVEQATGADNPLITILGEIRASGTGTLDVNIIDPSFQEADLQIGSNVDLAIIETGGGNFFASVDGDIEVFNATIIRTEGGDFTLIADNDEATAGDYTQSLAANVLTSGGDILIQSATIEIGGALDASLGGGTGGNITLQNSVATSIAIGDGVAGTYDLDQDELQALQTNGGLVTIGMDGLANSVALGSADLGPLGSNEGYDLTIFGDNAAGNLDFDVFGKFIMPNDSRLSIFHTGGDVDDENDAVITDPEIVVGGTLGELLIEAVNVGSILGLGQPELDVSVARLDVDATGEVHIDNTGGLTLVDLNASGGLTASGGQFNIEAESPITVSSPVTASGNIALTAVDDSTAPLDNLDVNANLTSTGGNVELNAGDNLTVASGVAISATTGSVFANIDSGNADAGAGATFSSVGATYAVSATGVLRILGEADDDTIVLTGPFAFTNGGRIEIDGNLGMNSVSVTDVDVTGALGVAAPALWIRDASTVNIHGPAGGTSDYNSTIASLQSGITLDNVGNVDIERITSDGNGNTGLEVLTAVNDLTIDDSTFDGNGNFGILVGVAATGAIALTNVSASNNDLDGVTIDGAASFSDTDGVYNDNSDTGVLLTNIAGTVAFDGTTANLNGLDGLNIDNPAAVMLTDVTASDNGDDGVDVNSAASVTLMNVVAGLNNSDGVEVGFTAGALSDTGGDYSDNGDDGVDVFNNTGTVTLTGTTASSNSGEGIDLSDIGGNVVANNVTADMNTSHGLSVDNSAVSINVGGVSSFSANTLDGIHLDNVGDVMLVNVTASGNDPGVNVNGAASFSDTDGVYDSNLQEGVLLFDIAGNVTLTGTSASDNGAAGIDITDVGGTVLLTNVTADDNLTGLSVETAPSVTVIDGSYSDNDVYGIQPTGISGVVDITDATIEGNLVAGIHTNNQDVDIDSNTFGGNAVDIDANGGNVLVERNVFDGTSTIGVLIRNGAVADLGQGMDPDAPGIDYTGLGISLGDNDFSAYMSAATAASGAIVVQNLDPTVGPSGTYPPDIAAFDNTFTGDPEVVIWHDADMSALAFVNPGDIASLTIADVSVDEEAGTATVTVVLNSPIALSAFTTDIVFTAGTATDGVDYTVTSPQTLMFMGMPGEFVDVVITINPDDVVEFDETIDVSLMNTTNASVDDSDTATVTITNNDFATITILNNVSELEGSGGGTTLFVYDIELSHDVQGDLSVDFTIADFTAMDGGVASMGGDDFDVPMPSPFNFGTNPAAGTYTLTIEVSADDVVEGDEEFILNLDDFNAATTANEAAIAIDTTPRFGDIVNDDQTSVTITDETVTEGTSMAGFTAMTFTVESSHAVQGGFLQPFTLNHLTTEAADLGSVTPSPLTFTGNAGEMQTITVNIRQDALVEFDEMFEIVLGVPIVPPGTGVDPADIVVTDGTGEGTIEDDDTATVTVNNVNLAEGTNGSTAFNFTLTLSGATVEDAFSVTVNTAEFLNEATSGVDYTALVNHLAMFPAGSVAGATQTVTVNVNADNITEDDEQFDVVLTDPFTMADEPDIDVNNVAGIGTIVNDDIAKISIIAPNPASITEGDSPATPDAVFTVQLSNPIEVPITVSFARDDVDTDSADFTAGGANTVSPITIPAGSTSATITVEILGDSDIEADEDFEVDLTGHMVPAPAGINPAHVMIDAMANSATATIVNDDTATIRVLDAATMMSSNISMTETTTTYMYVVKYEGDAIPTGADVDIDTANDTAVAPGDYTANSAMTSFTGPGMFAFNVTVNSDAIVEADEIFDILLTLTSVNNAAITLVDGTGTIVDDDTLTVEFSSAATASTEGTAIPAGQQPMLVVKGQSEIPVNIQVVQDGGDAVAADHNLPQTVVVPPNNYDGMAAGSFFPVGLQIVNDSLVENTETIVMETAPNADVTVGDANMNASTQATHTHTITDNDVYTVTGEVNGQQAVTINEGGKVTLTGTIFNTAQDHTVTVQWGDGASSSVTVTAAQFSGGQANYMLMHTYLDDVPTVSPTDTYSLVISVTSASNQQQIVGPAPQVTVNNVAPIFTSLNVNPTSGNIGQQVSVSGTYSDPGILDTFQFLIDTNNDGVFDITTPVSNGLIPTIFFNANQATNAFRFRITDDDSGLATQIVPVNFQGPQPPQNVVQDSRVFYNNSAFDGNNAAVNAADVNAIDTSKSSANIGQATTFANITGSDDGITGVTFVVSALPNDGAGLSLADFVVRRGTTNNINSWVAGPAPTGLLVLPNSVGGADRVLLTFASNSIVDTYASFQMLANANTGLASTHTAVFGNVRGDTGAAFVGQGSFFGRDAADLQAMVPALFQPAGVTSTTDINEDGTTNAFDLQVIPVVSTAAVGGAFQSNVLPVITPGFAAVPAPGFATAAVDEAVAGDDDDAPLADGNASVGAGQDGRVGGSEQDDRDLAFATFGSDDASGDLIGALAADRMSL